MAIRDFEPSKMDEALAVYRKAVSTFRGRPGIEEFWVARDIVDPTRIYMFEQWGDEDLINARIREPETRQFTLAQQRLYKSRRSMIWSAERLPELKPNQRVIAVKNGELVFEEIEVE